MYMFVCHVKKDKMKVELALALTKYGQIVAVGPIIQSFEMWKWKGF